MPKGEHLTNEIRQRAAASTNALIAERREARLARVAELAADEKTPKEIAQIVGVTPRTIYRDLDRLGIVILRKG